MSSSDAPGVYRPRPAWRSGRFEYLLDGLDGERDAHRILLVMANHTFPVDAFLALELGQLRTFTIPTISALLHRTRQYEEHGSKRLDDTKAILFEIVEPGPQVPEGQEMVEHLNRIHAAYTISNDDYLYTLSTFIFDPILWNNRYGWRPLRASEKQAAFEVYRQIGEQMGLRDIPDGLEAFWSWRVAYEARAQRFAASNRQVADGLMQAVASRLPAPFRRLVRPTMLALMDDPAMLEALGYEAPPRWFQAAVGKAMRGRQRLGRHVTLWEHGRFWDTRFFRTYPSYPTGYQRLRLGPDRIVSGS